MSGTLVPRQSGGGLAAAEPKLLAAFADVAWRDEGQRSEAIGFGVHLVHDRAPMTQASDRVKARAQSLINAAPTLDAIEALLPMVRAAAEAQADYAVTRMCVGLLLDSFPAGRPADFSRYAEALLHDLVDLGFAPAVVAKGCQLVRRTAKFLPVPVELISACEEARSALALRLRYLEHLRSYVLEARRVLSLPSPDVAKHLGGRAGGDDGVQDQPPPAEPAGAVP